MRLNRLNRFRWIIFPRKLSFRVTVTRRQFFMYFFSLDSSLQDICSQCSDCMIQKSSFQIPYYSQDSSAPLPFAFHEVGWNFAGSVVSIGALFGLSTSLLGKHSGYSVNFSYTSCTTLAVLEVFISTEED